MPILGSRCNDSCFEGKQRIVSRNAKDSQNTKRIIEQCLMSHGNKKLKVLLPTTDSMVLFGVKFKKWCKHQGSGLIDQLKSSVDILDSDSMIELTFI